jgi:hypothetical protein
MGSEKKIRLVVPDSGTGLAQGFSARLTGVTLADLIQMKCLSGASECIRIASAGKVGALQFSKGQLSHAATADLQGDNAVLELLNWRTGDCAPCATPLPPQSLVRRPWQGLLLHAAKTIDERAAAAPEPAPSTAVAELGEDTPTPVRARPVSLRLSRDGQVLESTAGADDLAATTAYAVHMANYIGQRLGLDAFSGGELRAGELRTVLVAEASGDVLAFQSEREADVAQARARAGV